MRVGLDPRETKCQAETSLIQGYDSSTLHHLCKQPHNPQGSSPTSLLRECAQVHQDTNRTADWRAEDNTGAYRRSNFGMNSAAIVLISMITSPQRGCGLLGPPSEKYGVQASLRVGSSRRKKDLRYLSATHGTFYSRHPPLCIAEES